MTASHSSSDSHALVHVLREEIDRALQAIDLPPGPASLYDPVRYVLSGGGKRFRPVLTLLATEMFGGDRRHALPAALALEVFHNFTLVHDDIMDHSTTRRGLETVHIRWSEPAAILAGDYLMALSYRLIAQTSAAHLSAVHQVFDQMVVRLCEGQALDKQYEDEQQIALSQYLEMIDLKTGALLEAALEIGAIQGGATLAERSAMREAGRHLGRAFQIQDDLLDLVAEDDRWGKTVGADLVEGKKTFLLVSALEMTNGTSRSIFERVAEPGSVSFDDVPRVRQAMADAGILDAAESAVTTYTDSARTLVASLGSGTGAGRALLDLITRMQARLH